MERLLDIHGTTIIKSFPNGFESWKETHSEICIAIGEKLQSANVTSQMDDYLSMMGRKGQWAWASELTDQFETKYKDVAWDVDTNPDTGEVYDFYNEIDLFIDNNL